MQVNQEVISYYKKIRNIRQMIQQNVKNHSSTEELVQQDIEISEKIRSLCDDYQVRELHRKLAIALDNEDYETSECVTKEIEKR
jgi:hypothetical protein